jgi:hypothetical protein
LKHRTPDQLQKDETLKLVKGFLKEKYVKLLIRNVVIRENLETDETTVECTAQLGPQMVEIKSTGAGLIDALFSGMREHFSQQYFSLDDIEFMDFSIDVDPLTRRTREGTDVAVVVDIYVSNSTGTRYQFSTTSRSFNNAAIKSVIDAIEYYLNCEVAVLELKHIIEQIKKSGRPELETKYVIMLSEIVRSASYVKSIQEWTYKN